MSNKILALAAAGAISFALVGCDLFDSGSSSSGSSSSGSSSSNGNVTKLDTNKSVTLGSANASAGSYLDADAFVAFKSGELTAANVGDVDAVYNIDSVYTPSKSASLTAKNLGTAATTSFVAVSAAAGAKLMYQEQVDSAFAASKSAEGVKLASGAYFIVKTSKNVNRLAKVITLPATPDDKAQVELVGMMKK